MFVRFRQQGNRLQASLMQTRRAAGRMLTEHIASLGSVDAEVSVRERLAFWLKLPDRLARLGNRVGPDEHGKIYGALHARIPMVTPDDQRAVQEENAETDVRISDAVHGASASLLEDGGVEHLCLPDDHKRVAVKLAFGDPLTDARSRHAELAREFSFS